MSTLNAVATVAHARDDLSRVLRRFRAGDLEPVVLGSHRKPEAVILPYATYLVGDAAHSAARTPTVDTLRRQRRLIMRLAQLAHVESVRVTGSVARGTATPESDIDLIVDPQPGASLFDLAHFADDLEQLLGYPVDVLSARSLDPIVDAQLIADAVAV